MFYQPKMPRSRRSIALGAEVVVALREHRAAQLERRLRLGSDYADQDLVFPAGTGGPLDPNRIWKQFPKTVAAAGVGPLRFHDLRHTAATLMLKAGTHARIVAERLGHASTSLTNDTYSHVVPSMQKDAAAAIDVAVRAPQRRDRAR